MTNFIADCLVSSCLSLLPFVSDLVNCMFYKWVGGLDSRKYFNVLSWVIFALSFLNLYHFPQESIHRKKNFFIIKKFSFIYYLLFYSAWQEQKISVLHVSQLELYIPAHEAIMAKWRGS